MFDFLKKRTFPIGIDLGYGTLKMMQLAVADRGLNLVAAAQAEVPYEIRSNPALLQEWYVETARGMLSERPFRGNRVVTALPAREVLVQHLRMPKMDPTEMARALPFEAQGKVPFDIHRARLCHVLAGEVYDGSQAKQEVILMAASHNVVQQHLSFLERTKLDIQAINVEPSALLNSFAHLLEKGESSDGATMFIDLGHSAAKVVITHGKDLAFCRTISSGGEHLVHAIAERLGVEYSDAQQLYARFCRGESSGDASLATPRPAPSAVKDASVGSVCVGGVSLGVGPDVEESAVAQEDPDVLMRSVMQTAVRHLCDELRGCVRYHDLLFSTQTVGKIIFVGGQAKNTAFCQQIARNLQLPAQLGDPLARINPDTRVGSHSDLQVSEKHSEWAVAFGLSLGQVRSGKVHA
ncbi:MAG: pilus assembly protein PilM [Sedimentisphaerales bacterium]|nr:pilus assembly protein PilM [Sedimentisphaerales bacterium]